MNVNELEGDLRELYCRRSSFLVPDIPSVTTNTAVWKLGPIFSERETYDEYDDVFDTFITEVAGVCVVTQVEGPNPGVQGIAKLRMQIPNDYEIPKPTKPQKLSARSAHELFNLKDLTAFGCSCTPKLLDYAILEQTRKNDPLPGGFFLFLVMERLPGRNLVNFYDLPMSERDQVSEFYALRFDHLDPDRRNLIWDRENKKCYIIDLEDAGQLKKDLEPKKFRPEIDFFNWSIAGPEYNTSEYGMDPMVPHDREYVVDPSDEVLEKWAEEAAGKGLYFRK